MARMALGDLTFDVLKAKQRRLRESLPSHLDLRIHRAISWVRGTERAAGDKDSDTAFICQPDDGPLRRGLGRASLSTGGSMSVRASHLAAHRQLGSTSRFVM